MGMYIEEAATLGRCTAELHLALSSSNTDTEFAPEPATTEDFIALSSELTQHARKVLSTLENELEKVPGSLRDHAKAILAAQPGLIDRFTSLAGKHFDFHKIRIHGDYHLGQLLWVKNDFVVLDFEGEPARSLAERRQKQFALKDVAGMIRSFGYAAYASLFRFASHRPSEFAQLEPWARIWQTWTSVTFMKSYLTTAADASFLPIDKSNQQSLLSFFLLDKALYELKYELNNRPDWIGIPLAGIQNLL